jgi:hypothetical protein
VYLSWVLPAGTESSAPGGCPSTVRPRSGPFVASVRPACKPASHSCSPHHRIRALRRAFALRLRVDAIHAHRTPQGCEVCHGIRTGGCGRPETAVQQAIPDRGGGAVLAEAQDFVVVHFPQRHIDRQLIESAFPARWVRHFIERMHVAHERPCACARSAIAALVG